MKPACTAVTVILPALLFLPGCPFECGGFDGAGDVMYRRGEDSLFLCTGGGFTANVAGRVSEGRFHDGGGVIDGAAGETGARMFELTRGSDGAWSSPELGAGWAIATLDKTELDHAHTQCGDIESRGWWAAPVDALPATTVFTRPAGGFTSVAACQAAQRAGSYPATAKCQDAVMLCANSRAVMMSAGAITSGSYSTFLGEVSASTTAGQVDGVFAADGTLTSGDQVWQVTPVEAADRDLVAAGCGA